MRMVRRTSSSDQTGRQLRRAAYRYSPSYFAAFLIGPDGSKVEGTPCATHGWRVPAFVS
jgi:hypothetical protein